MSESSNQWIIHCICCYSSWQRYCRVSIEFLKWYVTMNKSKSYLAFTSRTLLRECTDGITIDIVTSVSFANISVKSANGCSSWRHSSSRSHSSTLRLLILLSNKICGKCVFSFNSRSISKNKVENRVRQCMTTPFPAICFSFSPALRPKHSVTTWFDVLTVFGSHKDFVWLMLYDDAQSKFG